MTLNFLNLTERKIDAIKKHQHKIASKKYYNNKQKISRIMCIKKLNNNIVQKPNIGTIIEHDLKFNTLTKVWY